MSNFEPKLTQFRRDIINLIDILKKATYSKLKTAVLFVSL